MSHFLPQGEFPVREINFLSKLLIYFNMKFLVKNNFFIKNSKLSEIARKFIENYKLNGRRPQWKMTLLEDDLKGRQPKWKMTSMEENLNGK